MTEEIVRAGRTRELELKQENTALLCERERLALAQAARFADMVGLFSSRNHPPFAL